MLSGGRESSGCLLSDIFSTLEPLSARFSEYRECCLVAEKAPDASPIFSPPRSHFQLAFLSVESAVQWPRKLRMPKNMDVDAPSIKSIVKTHKSSS